MFCALNGATLTPWRANQRHSAVATNDFPASDVHPSTMIGLIAGFVSAKDQHDSLDYRSP